MHLWQPVRLILSCGPFLDIVAAKRPLERYRKINRSHTQKESIYTDLLLYILYILCIPIAMYIWQPVSFLLTVDRFQTSWQRIALSKGKGMYL